MRTLVYGLGESGIAAANALLDSGDEILLADSQDSENLRERVKSLNLDARLGATPEVVNDVERIVVSPGIPPADAILAEAGRRGIPVMSEVGMGLQLLEGDVRVAAITGTNGKTTVVDMISALLGAGDLPHAVAGNSWRALTGHLDEVREAGNLVLELSSFQLHYMESPGFAVAGLLNIRPDHMNWHTSYEEYIRDKLNIFAGQGGDDLSILSAADPAGSSAASSLGGRVLIVGRDDTGVIDGSLVLQGNEIVPVEKLPFAGIHNYENALFAAAAAVELGVSIRGIGNGLCGYRLKPHRLEVVSRKDDIIWVDDSKATNPAAVAAALSSFVRPVVLILGGSEKETSFDEVLPRLPGCRAVVCMGESGPRLYEYLRESGYGDAVLVSGLEEAVGTSRRLARNGDAVLLSPGCASFDEFAGYAERGMAFAELVTGGAAGEVSEKK